MDIFEYNEVRYPSRTLQQDEEEAATSVSGDKLEPPVIVWNEALKAKWYPSGVIVELVVVATNKASCALLNHAFPGKQVVGTVLMPDISMKGNTVSPSLQDRSCLVYSSGSRGQVLCICCLYSVPPERAMAVAKGIFKHICPDKTLVLGEMHAEQFHGQGDPSQAAMMYAVKTSEGRKEAVVQSTGLPPLPTGNLVSGLPAAIMSYCQVRHMSAELVTSIEMVASMQVHTLEPLARAVAGALVGVAAEDVVGPEVVAAARKAMGSTGATNYVFS